MNYGKTSEAVASGHPDKVADIISDSILDLCLEENRHSRCSVETMVCTNEVILRGECGGVELTQQKLEDTVRNVVKEIGYIDIEGFSYDTLKVNAKVVQQSKDIAMGVVGENKVKGSGDQGIMIGYATKETSLMLPVQFVVAKELMNLHNNYEGKEALGITPDAKSQFSLNSVGENVLVLSVSHREGADVGSYAKTLINKLVTKHLDLSEIISNSKLLLNPTGRFVHSGPAADTGLTGRKIVCDSYGGVCPVGGGAFSSKDPSKTDRSAAYMARYLATYLVDCYASKKEHDFTVRLAYAIGVAEPVSIEVQSNFLGQDSCKDLASRIKNQFDLTPQGIIDHLDLLHVKYAPTAYNGHFGVSDITDTKSFTWEKYVKSNFAQN